MCHATLIMGIDASCALADYVPGYALRINVPRVTDYFIANRRVQIFIKNIARMNEKPL